MNREFTVTLTDAELKTLRVALMLASDQYREHGHTKSADKTDRVYTKVLTEAKPKTQN